MDNSFSIRCACGELRGVAREIRPACVNRVVCYCSYCQSYADFLGCRETVLDRFGGTEVFQMSPSKLDITTGGEHIACVKLTEKGALRFYAGCCRTPLANTLQNVKMPFLAVNLCCVDFADSSLEEALGPIRARVNGNFVKQQAPPKADAFALCSMILHYGRLFMGWCLRGDARHSPFLNPQSGLLIVQPELAPASR